MKFFKSCLNLTLLSLLTCTGLAAPVLATTDFDNSVRDADDEGNLNSPGVRTINGDVTATDDLQDFRQVTLTGRANLRITGSSAGRTDLLLLSKSGQVIAKSSGSFSHSFTRNNLEAGKYIVLVRSAQFNANSVKYQVNLNARS
jgi:hypothetical protein